MDTAITAYILVHDLELTRGFSTTEHRHAASADNADLLQTSGLLMAFGLLWILVIFGIVLVLGKG